MMSRPWSAWASKVVRRCWHMAAPALMGSCAIFVTREAGVGEVALGLLRVWPCR
ncbi:hypothetical protein [Rhodococcus qingshengii]